LAKACLTVLPVSGAGLSVVDGGFRVPLGGSDELATVAERLQFTQGEGPCLDAGRSGRTVFATAADIKRRWPTFAEQLSLRTPFVAVVSLPMPLATDLEAVLDLYLGRDDDAAKLSIADATVVADQVVSALLVAQAISGSPVPSEASEPDWLHSPAAQQRRNVWVAMGMLMTKMQLSAEDALATLRAYAYSHDSDVDTVATGLVRGTVAVDEVAA
jgi:hypothetical protein